MVAIKHRTYRTLANAKTWDGSLLSGGESIRLINAVSVYDYVNVQDSRSALEPFTFIPNSNPGTNSWHLISTSARIGALVRLSADEPTVDQTQLIVPWDVAVYDDASFWTVGDQTKLTIPIGVTGVRITCNTRFESLTGNIRLIGLKNGATIYGLPENWGYSSAANVSCNFHSAEIDVVAADYFTLSATQMSGGAKDVLSDNRTWFSIEAVGFA